LLIGFVPLSSGIEHYLKDILLRYTNFLENMIMKKIAIVLFLFLILSGCKKSTDNLSISNSVAKTRYYNSEIFNVQNQKLYGKWEWLYYTNPGNNVKIVPITKYLEIVRFGIFGYLDDNNINAISQVVLTKQDDLETIIQLIPDSEYSARFDIITKKIQFKSNDTLLLSDTFIGGLTVMYYKRTN
jgi:hypothetical protein